MGNEIKAEQAVLDIDNACRAINNIPGKRANWWLSGLKKDSINVVVYEGFHTESPVRTINLDTEQERIPGLLADLAAYCSDDLPPNHYLGLSIGQGRPAFLEGM